MKFKKILALLIPALVAAFFQSCQTSQKAVYSADQLVPKEKSLLWRISGNGLKKPSYLFGTIHMIPRSQLHFSPAVERALSHVKRVAFEIDMREMTNLRTQFGLMTKAMMAGNKTLRDLLSPEDYAFVRSKVDAKGMPMTFLERLKPMFLSTMMGTDENNSTFGGEGMTSMEMEIYGRVKRDHLESAGLETAAFQMALFDSIPYADQAKMLVDGLRDNDHGDNEYDKMVEMYLDQNIDAMNTLINSEGSGMQNFENLLLDNRNRNWSLVMPKLMRQKQTLFAVGAGHLGGEFGVIALLRKLGYKVEAEK